MLRTHLSSLLSPFFDTSRPQASSWASKCSMLMHDWIMLSSLLLPYLFAIVLCPINSWAGPVRNRLNNRHSRNRISLAGGVSYSLHDDPNIVDNRLVGECILCLSSRGEGCALCLCVQQSSQCCNLYLNAVMMNSWKSQLLNFCFSKAKCAEKVMNQFVSYFSYSSTMYRYRTVTT